jgi:PHD/YefM family antitoxin component YafN of YafNO toxin-antitoxin module
MMMNYPMKMKETSFQEPVTVMEVNDEDAGLAARGELDDAETKRELAGLLAKIIIHSREISQRNCRPACDKQVVDWHREDNRYYTAQRNS